ncbi:hypothetical protein AVEN_86549-1 [Araneus ventricosus]|uniref:Uncharacterized protein n=1 Tax=Araneus ventricosus TaxID=182803 RepID=A0A4Y2FWE4_ARAVE|nr:hypothetical protein AVEN_86549-1 [Araneus ventricosus]
MRVYRKVVRLTLFSRNYFIYLREHTVTFKVVILHRNSALPTFSPLLECVLEVHFSKHDKLRFGLISDRLLNEVLPFLQPKTPYNAVNLLHHVQPLWGRIFRVSRKISYSVFVHVGITTVVTHLGTNERATQLTKHTV